MDYKMLNIISIINSDLLVFPKCYKPADMATGEQQFFLTIFKAITLDK